MELHLSPDLSFKVQALSYCPSDELQWLTLKKKKKRNPTQSFAASTARVALWDTSRGFLFYADFHDQNGMHVRL